MAFACDDELRREIEALLAQSEYLEPVLRQALGFLQERQHHRHRRHGHRPSAPSVVPAARSGAGRFMWAPRLQPLGSPRRSRAGLVPQEESCICQTPLWEPLQSRRPPGENNGDGGGDINTDVSTGELLPISRSSSTGEYGGTPKVVG